MCENADKYRGFQIFETLLVVLNVVGSSPTGHPKEVSPCKSNTYRGFTILAPQILMEH